MRISDFQGHPGLERFYLKSALALEENKQTKITGFRQTDSLKNIEQIFGSEKLLSPGVEFKSRVSLWNMKLED